MPAGRPRHDDVLTPREWQVLDLLRGGLTNEQIAASLCITADTAKFHVSEILTKLGVQNRQQAAAWSGHPRAIPSLGLPDAIARHLASLSPLKLAGAAVIVAAALATLAALVLLDSISEPHPQTVAPDGRTGDEELDDIIEVLLEDDAAGLASRFAGVTAREGQVVGGNAGGFFYFENTSTLDPGMRPPLQVPGTDWTARLGASQRRLHAVVKDPREPFAWWEQSTGPAPRAAVFLEPRDYDIVLVVDSNGESHPWRFSLRNGRIVDIVIVDSDATPSLLASLTPSIDDEPGAFLVLPAEKDRAAPRPLASSPNAQFSPVPAGVANTTFAPDGRTGDATIDRVIAAVLQDDAGRLAQRVGTLAAREVRSVPNTDPNRPGDYRFDTVRVATADWTQRLVSGSRSLYAVFTSDVADVEFLVAVKTDAGAEEGWKFAVRSGALLEVEIRSADYTSSLSFQDLVSSVLPSVPFDYQRFFVLPPRDELPVPPATRPLSTRTGDTNIDRLISLVEARDVAGLIAAAVPPDDFVYRGCIDTRRPSDADDIEAWARETAASSLRLHSVANVPQGWDPKAQHVLILVKELNPYRWESLAIFEHDGQIVGVSPGGYCAPGRLAPPARLLVALADDLDPARRSGTGAVDAIIDALQTGNEAAIGSLIQYSKVPCSNEVGVGAPPKCPDGVVPGTPVDALERGCEGYYYTPPTAAAQLIRSIGGSSLYALVERPPLEPSGSPVLAVTLDKAQGVAYTLLIAGGRIIRVETTCPAPSDTIWQVSGMPDFLLPPP